MVAIPDFQLKSMHKKGGIVVTGTNLDDIQPASIDIGPIKGPLRITEYYSNVINGNYLSDKYAPLRGDFNGPVIFETDKTYIVNGPHVILPENIEGHIEQKSTTGRLGLYNELLLPDKKGKLNRANYIPGGYNGETFFRIENRAFPIQIEPGDKIAQLRLAYADGPGFLTARELGLVYGDKLGLYPIFPEELKFSGHTPEFERDYRLKFDSIIERGINGTILTADTQLVFKQREGVSQEIVYSKKEQANIEDYWKILLNRNPILRVDTKTLYLTSSAEVVRTGNGVCWKMGMKTEGLGPHMETHRAGFGDPGFRARVTAEIINHHKSFLLVQGQYLSHLLWEDMADIPEKPYTGHYQGQIGPIPPKHFKNYDKVWDMVKDGQIKSEIPDQKEREEFFTNLRKPLSLK